MQNRRPGLLRKGWDWVSNLSVVAWLADIGKALLVHWSTLLSALVSAGLTFWAWTASLNYFPLAIVALGTFTAAIWALNGIVWLRRQRRPSRERIAFDCAYGLALLSLHIGRDERKKESAVQLGIVLGNAADGPILYYVEEMDVIIGTAAIPHPMFANRGGVIPRGTQTTFFYPPFPKSVIQQHVEGVLRCSIIYGHPDFGFIRRFRRQLSLSMRLDAKTSVVYTVTSESDEAIPTVHAQSLGSQHG